ncbi:hypothetical protein QLX52_13245 [Streptomyces albus]|uniref:hypothetical protein n=1 Tax=Streptomyces TaxID=1883 RepID=UPI001CEC58E0|nr:MULTISPECIES: hypothetical protein [Streptomyces]MDI6409796.1 hypothetical protein [Streptomyces albus]
MPGRVSPSLCLESGTLSCGVRIYGRTGRTNGALSEMAATGDGTHRMAFNIDGGWSKDASTYVGVVEAVFRDSPGPVGSQAGQGAGPGVLRPPPAPAVARLPAAERVGYGRGRRVRAAVPLGEG